ncbi:MAG: hypothetical protein AVDCRST_MAG68-2111 [uncultured Gemmatimonadetes bacterium]|uniref:Uncharacterized protein n=1 Tax=uncultured Gemmatimonadota bacterium TaxID=203437 RepID=A0A6J4L483_9BACT|nr:MAG: hypothetical protein AVDCRST_MAG68-2111 [uncultured Gemmatimonadota bacterium]
MIPTPAQLARDGQDPVIASSDLLADLVAQSARMLGLTGEAAEQWASGVSAEACRLLRREERERTAGYYRARPFLNGRRWIVVSPDTGSVTRHSYPTETLAVRAASHLNAERLAALGRADSDRGAA